MTKWELGLFCVTAVMTGAGLGLVWANVQMGEAKVKVLQQELPVLAQAKILRSFRSYKEKKIIYHIAFQPPRTHPAHHAHRISCCLVNIDSNSPKMYGDAAAVVSKYVLNTCRLLEMHSKTSWDHCRLWPVMTQSVTHSTQNFCSCTGADQIRSPSAQNVDLACANEGLRIAKGACSQKDNVFPTWFTMYSSRSTNLIMEE